MDKQTKQEMNHMLSLMERMDKHLTNNEAVLSESIALNESTRVMAKDAVTFMTKNSFKKGDFVSLGYIQMYAPSAFYGTDNLKNTMQGMENDFETERGKENFRNFMSSSEWNVPEGRPNKEGIRGFKNKIYKYVIKLTTYRLNWQDKDSWHNAMAKDKETYNDLVGTAKPEWQEKYRAMPKSNDFDPEVDDFKERYRFTGPLSDYGIANGSVYVNKNYEPTQGSYFDDIENPDSKVTYDKLAILNYLSDVRPQKPVYFGVYENGDIDPIPSSLGKILHNVPEEYADIIQQLQNDANTDPDELAFVKKLADYKRDNGMRFKQFMLTNVAYICASLNENINGPKTSLFWVNEHPLFLAEKTVNKEKVKYKIHLNEEELKQILDRFASKEADDIIAY